MSLYIDLKYIQMLSSTLERYRKKSTYLINCRCPFCGDSNKKKTKARGYIYRRKDALFYYCHNCTRSVTAGALIKFLNKPLYDQYKLEKYLIDKPISAPIIQQERKPKVDLDLPKIESLPHSNVAVKYLRERKIPNEYFSLFYYAEDFQSWALKITDGTYKKKYHLEIIDPRIVIPFYDQSYNLIAVQGRSLLPTKLRYVTIKFSETEKIFGLERWHQTENTLIVEGPFDSLFLPNCLAMAGSSVNVSAVFPNKQLVTFIMDNENRNREICRRMEGIINDGYNICIWPETNTCKDINDMILSGRTKENILEEIKENTFSGLNAKLILSRWRRC